MTSVRTWFCIIHAVLLLLVCKVIIWSENREGMKQLGIREQSYLSLAIEPWLRRCAVTVSEYLVCINQLALPAAAGLSNEPFWQMNRDFLLQSYMENKI